MAYDTKQLDSVLQGLQGQMQKPQGVLGQLDPMKLALAQGFFAPTKTGGFGESVSNALGALQSPLKTMADQNSSIQDKIMQIRLAQAKLAGRSPEDAEDARNERFDKRMQKSALDRDLSLLDVEIGKIKNDPDKAEELKDLKAKADAIRAQRDELIGLKRPAVNQPPAQPQQSGGVGPGSKVGEERQFKQGIGVWNGTAWVPKGQ
jgi:hypothetical protein